MNKFYTQTTLPTPNIDYKSVWLNDPTDVCDTIPRWQLHTLKTNFWPTKIQTNLASQNLFPELIRIFRWHPNGFFPWHVDGTVIARTNFAINWVLDGTGIIQWNSKLNLPPPEPKHATLAYGSIISTPNDAYEETNLGHGCLVNTTIPHRVVNNNDIHRITVSMLFGTYITYEQAVEKLSVLGYVK